MEDFKIYIAFYKDGEGKCHKLIRWWTKSVFSHVELVLPDKRTWVSISPFLSSRVAPRIKYKIEDPEKWEFVEFPVSKDQLDSLYDFIEHTQGSRYDWFGMLLSQFTPYLIKRKEKWYCSEWIAHALVKSGVIHWSTLKIYDTPDLHPGKLYKLLAKHKIKTRIYGDNEDAKTGFERIDCAPANAN